MMNDEWRVKRFEDDCHALRLAEIHQAGDFTELIERLHRNQQATQRVNPITLH